MRLFHLLLAWTGCSTNIPDACSFRMSWRPLGVNAIHNTPTYGGQGWIFMVKFLYVINITGMHFMHRNLRLRLIIFTHCHQVYAIILKYGTGMKPVACHIHLGINRYQNIYTCQCASYSRQKLSNYHGTKTSGISRVSCQKGLSMADRALFGRIPSICSVSLGNSF